MLSNILISLFPNFFARYFAKKDTLIWLIHPRDYFDICNQIPIMKILPTWMNHLIIISLPPIIISKIRIKNTQKGYVIAIPMLPDDFKKKQKLAKKKLLKALLIADCLNANTISVGGFISSMVDKYDMRNKFRQMSFHNGSNMLSDVIINKIKQLNKEFHTIGIIGANTISGKLITQKLLQQTQMPKKIIIIGRNHSKLLATKQKLQHANKHAQIKISTTLSDVAMCDLVILTAYIQSDEEVIMSNLKSGTVFICAIEPTSPFVYDLMKLRTDIVIINDISVNVQDLQTGIKTNLPKNKTFVCIAEAINNMNT